MLIKKSILAAMVFGILLVATPATSVFADGNGYSPPGGSSVGQTSPAYATVLAAQTIGSSGATIATSASGSRVSVVVPSGAFGVAEQVTLTGGNASILTTTMPSQDTVVAAFGVNFSGAVPTKAITLTVVNPSIPAGAKVYKVTGSGLIPVNATVTPGKVVISFSSDPDFVIVSQKSNVVAGATSPVTGVPITRDLLGGLALLVLGGAIMFFSTRRRVL